jgi:DNA-binding transcriptional LysR family regulator
MLNLNQLRSFYEVAKSLNFSIAAENLSVSQPAVTKQIKSFESFWNLRLFAKRRGKIHLTEEGKKIFIYASRIFELEMQLEEAISGLQNLKQGSLRIGTTKTYARHFMPILLTPFQKTYPDIIIELDEGSSLEMSRSLLDFKNSIALVAKVEDHPDILFTPIMLEEVVLVMAPDFHLSGRDEIPFKELAGEPIVMKEVGSGTRKIVEQCASDEKMGLNIIAQTSNMEFIKQLIRQKRALSFVVKSAVEKELASGELLSVPIRGHSFVLDVFVATLRDYDLPHPTKIFLEYITSTTQSKDMPTGIADFEGAFKSFNQI